MKITEVTAALLFWVIVPEFSLQSVRAQEGMCHKRAGQAARGNVLAELKAQEVSVKGESRGETS